VIGTLYGYDPLSCGWGRLLAYSYIYNEFCYDITLGISKVVDLFFPDV